MPVTQTIGWNRARILAVRRRLMRWGTANFGVYPWRIERDPWRTLFAELLL